MWTNSGIFIEKRDSKYIVYASDETELIIFADGYGVLRDFFIEKYSDIMKDNGIYQAITGYGRIGGMNDPVIYEIKKLSGPIDWHPSEEE